MIEEFARGIVVYLFSLVLRLFLLPVALIIGTPVILIRAWILALRQKQRFAYAVSDGYSFVWEIWWAY
jgi:hypothetical protein